MKGSMAKYICGICGGPHPTETHHEAMEAEDRTIEVSQDEEWKSAKSPEIIGTTGLGPCLGVILYDPETKQAMVGHFDMPEALVPKMLKEVETMFPDKSRVKIWLGGNQPIVEIEDWDLKIKEQRKKFKDFFLSNGFSENNVTAKYQDSNEVTSMRIDTATGQVDYDVMDEDDTRRDR